MRSMLARALAAPFLLLLASGCIDEARCDAALEGAARAQREVAHRDYQIAWLGWRQAELARTVASAQRADRDPEREALRKRVAELEEENASLMVRLGHAERERVPEARRRLDEAVPYGRRGAVGSRGLAEDDDEGLVRRGAPRAARTLDEAVPYEASAGARAPRAAAVPSKRTLDEVVPY